MTDSISTIESSPANRRSPSSASTVDAAGMTAMDDRVHRPQFPKDSGFQADVNRRVTAYFQLTGQRPRDCWQMYLKTFIILAWCVTTYALLVFVVSTWWTA